MDIVAIIGWPQDATCSEGQKRHVYGFTAIA